MDTLAVQSPAKLNLFLHVTGRRPDGYHTLQTLFQLIDLCDTLTFAIPPQPGLLALHCTQPDMPLEDNLVLQAARLLREAAGLPRASADIQLEKRIPHGAGLGGGSSNAAVTLRTLNRLWDAGLSRAALSELGLRLGADVPLFIQGHSALATGVGEVLEPWDLGSPTYLLVWPRIVVSTAEIFARPELTRNSPAIKIADFLAGGGRNDCEPVVRSLYPEVDAALVWLTRFGKARMTGTGSCVFVDLPSQAEALEALADLPARFQGYVVKGLNKMP